MLDIHHIRENTESVIQGLRKKYFARAADIIEELLAIDQQRRATQLQLDNTASALNTQSQQIGQLIQQGKAQAAEVAKAKTSALKVALKDLTQTLQAHERALHQQLSILPNLPTSAVPEGDSASDNVVVYQSGEVAKSDATLRPHWELTQQYNLVDFALGNKITGAGFPVYRGLGARLQRALINFCLDEARKAGYEEIQPPILVNEASAYGTGQLPDKEGQMYQLKEESLYLIPTAEVSVTNMYRDVMLAANEFPIKHVAYTPCFRREAGSWGSHVRGLNRLHQFDKVEIVQVQVPEKAEQALEEMCSYVRLLLEQLALPYRVVNLCGGDLGFSAAMTYDMEVWAAGQQRWLEVSSVSTFAAYQARRMQLRYKDAQGKRHFPHTLNGSALALPRIVVALLESHQTSDGIRIPAALQPYTGFEVIK
ncbi:MAG: serine--tRNA ligase [Bacteroidota bacterium]